MAPSLILFDLDETLFDHMHASRSGLEALGPRHPELAGHSLDELESRAFRILEDTHRRVLAGEVTPRDARTERLRRLFGTVGSEPEGPILEQAARIYGEAYRRSRRAVEGARALLGALSAGHAIGVVTNHFRDSQRAKLDDCGLADLVDFMVTSEDSPRPKPDPSIFRIALDRGGATAAETVMVGDSWDADVVGARNAGIRPVWFNRRGRRSAFPVDELCRFEPTDRALEVILGGTRI
jgi:putative hydrolase of the HAD superfamily